MADAVMPKFIGPSKD